MRILYGVLAGLCLMTLGSACSAESIGQIKASAAIGAQVSVTGAVTYAEANDCYIESTDRSSGIWVQAPTAGISVGSIVTATGAYSIVSGEPAIVGATITPQVGLLNIAPFAMNNSAVGGNLPDLSIRDYAGDGIWIAAKGAPNIGMLIKTWGIVNAVYSSATSGAKWFYIDDGYGATSDSGDTGILVYSGADVKQGQFVTVTGVSSVEPSFDDPNKLIRVVRTRSVDDVQVLKEVSPGPKYPFSDEFDSPKLDARWNVGGNTGSVSTTSVPGWLALTVLPDPSVASTTLFFVRQIITPNCDIEIKARIEPIPVGSSQDFRVDFNLWDSGAAGSVLWIGSRIGYPTTMFSLNADTNPPYVPMTVDTFWLRIRLRGTQMYCCYSFDGVTYSAEHLKTFTTNKSVIYLTTSSGKVPYTVYLDYIRFTPVNL